ncbi:MAG: hypothetical protein WD823_05185 [Sulfuricaulis sp.]|uniref:hypothetical protein n=1 Tax=Sulfuricaulis sp. TaxID=2003553 RepID=UPI0034A32FE5
MARILLGCIILVLYSCASVGTINFGISDSGVTNFAFIDARQGGLETAKLPEENKSVTVLGDKNFTPPVPAILKARLQEKLGSKLASRKVTLSYLLIEIHEREPKIDEAAYESSRAGVGIDPVSNLLARWVIKGIERHKNNKIVIVEMKGSVDNREFLVRENGYFKRDGETEIKRVVLLTVDNVVYSIEALLNDKIH